MEIAKTGAPPNARNKARDYILAHPEAKNVDVARETRVSPRTVSNARASLIREGRVMPAAGDRSNASPRVEITEALKDASVFDVQTTSDLAKAVGARLQDADFDENGNVQLARMKRVLWRVARTNQDDRVVVAATSALARIQQETTARSLGPGAPLTEADALDRLTRVNRPVGLKLAFKALLAAFGAADVIKTFMAWIDEVRNVEAADPRDAAPATAAHAGAADDHAVVRAAS